MLSLLMFRPWPLILPAVRMLRFLWGGLLDIFSSSPFLFPIAVGQFLFLVCPFAFSPPRLKTGDSFRLHLSRGTSVLLTR